MRKRIVKALAAAAVLLFVAGSVSVAQDKKANPSETGESLIGNVVADAMRDAMGTDVAIINAGSLGTGQVPIIINEKNIERVLPYPGEIVVSVTPKGADIVEALEKSVAALPRRNSGFLQVSGLSFSADLSKKSGSRVFAVRIGGAGIDPGKTYTVAMTDFLAGGGSGYSSLKNGKVVSEEGQTLELIVLNNASAPENGEKSLGKRIKIILPE